MTTLTRKLVEKPRPEASEYISDGHGNVRIMGIMPRDADGYLRGQVSYSFRKTDSREWDGLAKVVQSDSGLWGGFEPYAVDSARNVAFGFDDNNGYTALYAMTLDGRIAATGGDSRWVSGVESRRQVHLLRDEVDAIMVGVGTLLGDDPELTTRLVDHWRPVHHPLRVLVDSRGRAPLSARLFAPELPGRTLVATVDPPSGWQAGLSERGVEVERLPADGQGQVDLAQLLRHLAGRGINHLLVEGGSQLLGSLNDHGLIDQIQAYVAPKLVGGAGAPGPLAGSGVRLMAEARPYDLRHIERYGDDLLLVATASGQPWWSTSEEEGGGECSPE